MRKLAFILPLCLLLVSCVDIFHPEAPEVEYDRVLILYSDGFNTLSGYLREDINDMTDTWGGARLPKASSGDALVVISHQTASYGNYKTPTSPVIYSLGTDPFMKTVYKDTLYVAPEGARLSDAGTMREMLEKVMEAFPSKHYGMVLSSHGTGWLPQGWYDKGLSSSPFIFRQGTGRQRETWHPDINEISSVPVKTCCQEYYYDPDSPSSRLSSEIDLRDLAGAFPMHMDYLIFDACLMGGVEVAYELRDVASVIGFSQTEILADGLDYGRLCERLLGDGPSDPEAVCEDYYNIYLRKSGINRSATFSLIDCSQLEELAGVCRPLFDRYRSGIRTVNPDEVQRYFRFNCHWFYDLEDILSKSGASNEDMSALESALGRCVLYKAATEEFMLSDNGFKIRTACGLSMFLPYDGDLELHDYYRNLEWNKATGLVE